ncbi:MAG: hypothetical protein PHC64_06375 [Candidatus Gastranaerophilales bacterium]|nr:hypothetical protein [Candidatus Gastranaerophilales bacterium]
MKKVFFGFFIFIFLSVGQCFADEGFALRDYDGIELAKGTFIPVISTQEISTQYCDVGTVVKFIAISDLYLNDTNIIPQNTEFFGYIEKINEPVVATNASMIIKVSKIRFIDGFELPMRGYIYVNNNIIIGGELTPPATYEKKPSFRQGFKTTNGYVPGATRQPGVHKVIASGANLLIVLTGPLYVTHTVNN